jgi:hypothetical protein
VTQAEQSSASGAALFQRRKIATAIMFTASVSSPASAGAKRVILLPRWLPIGNTTARVMYGMTS